MGIWTQKAPPKGQGGGDIELCPAGNHPAVLVGIIDLGTQKEQKFQSTEFDMVHKVMLVWEIPGEMKSASKVPFTIGADYRLSFHEKANIRKVIERWRGKSFAENEEFDMSKMLGKPCLLSVTHKQSRTNPDRTYSKVDGVSALPKGMQAPKNSYTPLLWSIEAGATLPAQEWLPFYYGEPLADVIKRSSEWVDMANRGGAQQPVTTGGSPPQDEDAF